MLGAGGVVKDRYYWHAWAEVEVPLRPDFPLTFVVDKSSGQDLVLPKEFYYQRGEPRHIFRYPERQARRLLNQRKHFGPWVDNYRELCDV